MANDSRSITRDAHLEAARRLGERAKACAQWRCGSERIEHKRPAATRVGVVEHRQSGAAGRRGEGHSRA